jgi:hypothetical protein
MVYVLVRAAALQSAGGEHLPDLKLTSVVDGKEEVESCREQLEIWLPRSWRTGPFSCKPLLA